MIPALIAGGIGLVGTIVAGLLNNKSQKETNEANLQAVQETNESNEKSQNTANLLNILLNKANNEANIYMNDVTNQSNLQAINSTNEYNKQISDATNLSNQQLAAANNKANYDIATQTNNANYKIAQETNSQNAANVRAQNEANLQIAQDTNRTNAEISAAVNETNRGIAEQNLSFQRENLDYQKALQQQIFEREDTAYQRTAADMAKAGLNPLSMNGTNGAGEVVSTSALNNSYNAQGYTAQGATMNAAQAISAVMNPFSSERAVAQGFTALAPNASKADLKAATVLAHKAQAFQRNSMAFDWLSNAMNGIGNSVDQAIQHGYQRDQLNIQKQLADAETINKLRGTGYIYENGKIKPITYDRSFWDNDSGAMVTNIYSGPQKVESLALENRIKELERNNKYGIYNSSTDFERNITGLQYMMDNGKIESIGNSLSKEAINLYNSFRKMYNHSF